MLIKQPEKRLCETVFLHIFKVGFRRNLALSKDVDTM